MPLKSRGVIGKYTHSSHLTRIRFKYRFNPNGTGGGVLEAETACNGVAVTNDFGRIPTVGSPYTGHGDAMIPLY